MAYTLKPVVMPDGIEGEALMVMVELRKRLGRCPRPKEFDAEVRRQGWTNAQVREFNKFLEKYE